MMNESIESLVNSGQTLMNLGNPKDALVIYNKILAQDPNHIVALLKKGHILGQLARYKEAIIQYDNVLSQEKNLLALLNKGLAHHYLGQVDVALDCYEQVLKEKPNNPTTLYNKASSLIKSGKIQEGIKILSDVIKIDYSFKEKAKYDIEFEGIRKLNEFKEIVV
ncbi:TPR repeat domain containing protein [Marine Group I thaumarchaeote SCGC AAA799-B03]|uniref:TPR repeat domain containing protein n=5 Tax=Marine Group I TaxID=905826 RepID=A0A087S830_9ARCH|nr:TPR repeat domain containing protein [Marine Group I thaumarchaeote SCGC AAA799-N04]KFM17068.1 TPR repeat domain containing protein [Marine Group I thaumarchaeote SCGC AAA799-D11]KFM19170.1 TPR repeat domain containing protein [Marine Group I thaumarchaeote SCGC RSA3]KFM21884.1 TPR repeat domain containing protein [Marine Group I thaumarchaeote SCGC AAA799-B03]